jgi:Protein of unknown function (DUF2505)
MRFQTEQHFDASRDRLLALFTDPDFYATLVGLPKISTPEVVEHRTSGSAVHLGLRQRFTGQLPAAALAMIDPAKLSWVEEVDFDLDRATATTVLVPDHYADRFSCAGTYAFVADGGASWRRLSGDVRVRMPLVGGKVEGALASGLREHADAEAVLIASHLASS